MIQVLKVCPHCGEEYSEQWGHECEGTRMAEVERFAEELTKYWLDADEMKISIPYSSANVIKVENDAVHHPKHYTSHPSGVECIDITKHYNFQIGNAMKYLWRQGLKDEVGLDPVEKQIQDCEKAIWYITSYINDLKGTK